MSINQKDLTEDQIAMAEMLARAWVLGAKGEKAVATSEDISIVIGNIVETHQADDAPEIQYAVSLLKRQLAA